MNHALNYVLAGALLAVPLILFSIALVLQIRSFREKFSLRSGIPFIVVGIFSAIMLLIPFWVLGLSACTWNRLGRAMVIVSLVPLIAATRPGASGPLRLVLLLGTIILCLFWYFNQVIT